MLSQEEAERLLEMLKELVSTGTINFPQTGDKMQLHVLSHNKKEKFVVDINRATHRGSSLKCTYQERYRREEILLRVDLDGPPHTNPDGKIIDSPNHIHIYREGYGLSYAWELPANFTATNDLAGTLLEFLEYCKVTNLKELILQGGFS